MSVQELAMRLPRVEKLRLMEALWDDLSHEGVEVDSPSWHEAVLRETEQRVVSGEEAPLDWDAAKRHLRRL
ncbi:MAG: addiction module protein [Verrucomicrobia bacterium]|nr:addiction module protein [Verrucomicrobiota bacterium]